MVTWFALHSSKETSELVEKFAEIGCQPSRRTFWARNVVRCRREAPVRSRKRRRECSADETSRSATDWIVLPTLRWHIHKHETQNYNTSAVQWVSKKDQRHYRLQVEKRLTDLINLVWKLMTQSAINWTSSENLVIVIHVPIDDVGDPLETRCPCV